MKQVGETGRSSARRRTDGARICYTGAMKLRNARSLLAFGTFGALFATAQVTIPSQFPVPRFAVKAMSGGTLLFR